MQPLISTNPWTGDVLWHGDAADAATCQAAMARAQAALADWRHLGAERRGEILARAADIIGLRSAELSTLIMQETGKPRWEAATEVAAVGAKLARCQAAAERWLAANGGDRVHPRPVGVGVILGPFNLPAHLVNGWLVAGLLAGNSVIVKPSERCPAIGEALVAAYHAAGVPAAVLQCIQGDRTTAAHLLADPRLGAVWFTGSRAGGVAIHRALAGRPEVGLALEMGGNNPLVVWDGDDHAAIARLVMRSAFITAGQRCVCARRLILPTGATGDQLLEAIVATRDRLIVGDPGGTPQPFIGPVIDTVAAQAVIDYQTDLIARGGSALRACTIDASHPALVYPGIITVPTAAADHECFGPLLQVVRADSFDHALTLASTTSYGLAAGLVSQDPAQWQQFLARVPAGVSNWNRPITGAAGDLPFGGLGHSGNHHPAGANAVWSCQDPIACLSSDVVGAEPISDGLKD